MFSLTDALHNQQSNRQHDRPLIDSPSEISSYPSEKQSSPVSPHSTLCTPGSPSPGLELVVNDDETLKEATIPDVDPIGKEFYKHPSPPLAEHPRKGRKWIWIIAATVLIVVLAIALGVGLGVGLKKKKG